VPRSPYRASGSAAPRTADDCVEVSAVTRARPSKRTHSQTSTTMTAASRARRATAGPGRPLEASWIACAASPGGSQRSHASTPPKLVACSLPSALSLGTTWVNAS